MRKVVAFANASAKRHKIFEKELEGMVVQGICETRWVERHDGHLQFQAITWSKCAMPFAGLFFNCVLSFCHFEKMTPKF